MRSSLKTIALSGFTAGSLDILTAFFVYSFLQNKATPTKILQSVASGIFKAKAYSGGTQMAIYGLILHFCIAFIFAAFYFFLFRRIAFLSKQKIASGILYGIFVWAVMNLIVLPLVFMKKPSINLESMAVSMSILILMIGLPISLITGKTYNSKAGRLH